MIPLNDQAIVALRLAISQVSLYQGADKLNAKFALVTSTFVAIACDYMASQTSLPTGSIVYRDFQSAVAEAARTLDRMTRNPFDPRVMDEELVDNYRISLKLGKCITRMLASTGQKGFKISAPAGDWIADIIVLLELTGFFIEIDMTDNRGE